jgi:Uma2 family endonuclease
MGAEPYTLATMVVALLDESPFGPQNDLGPYRAADYSALPDEPRCELIQGRFFVTPSPAIPHQLLVFELAKRLDTQVRPLGGEVFIAPLDVKLAEHSIVQPDVLYISPDRREILGDRRGWIDGAPDLLIEILSPGTARRDRVQKLALYARSGVKEYWIVDPTERQVEFLVHENGRFVVALPDGNLYRSPALPEISLDLGEFWGEAAHRLR